MRRLAFLLVGSAVILAYGAAPALADNGPHQGFGWTGSTTYTFGDGNNGPGSVSTDRCSGCHRAHTAQGQYLLKQEQPGLCLSCHGATGTGASTDVYDGRGYVGADGVTPDKTRGASYGALRAGGFEFALINTVDVQKTTTTLGTHGWGTKAQHIPTLVSNPNNLPTSTTSSHNVDLTNQMAWGNGAISATANYGASVPLTCTSCHDPHGNGNFRILRPIPDASGATTGVTIPDASTKVYVTNDYWESGDPNTPAVSYTNAGATPTTVTVDAFSANIAQWCTTCHTRYLASSGSYKTASGDAVFMYRHRTDKVGVLNNADYTDLASTTKVEGGGGPNCITCHVAHGSNATMGANSSSVTNPDGSEADVNNISGVQTGTVGDSRLLRVDNRGMCLLCHSV